MARDVDRMRVAGDMTNLMSAKHVDRETPPSLGAEPVERKTNVMREASRAAFRFVAPVARRTTWYVVLGVTVLMVLWEIDDAWQGTIYDGIRFLRENVLKKVPLVPFLLGVAARHYLFDDRRRS